jgi:hypothetical protein
MPAPEWAHRENTEYVRELHEAGCPQCVMCGIQLGYAWRGMQIDEDIPLCGWCADDVPMYSKADRRVWLQRWARTHA